MEWAANGTASVVDVGVWGGGGVDDGSIAAVACYVNALQQ